MEKYAAKADDMKRAKEKAEGVVYFVDRLRNGAGSLDRADNIRSLDSEFRLLARYLGYQIMEAAQ